jgi:hypothetical protein
MHHNGQRHTVRGSWFRGPRGRRDLERHLIALSVDPPPRRRRTRWWTALGWLLLGLWLGAVGAVAWFLLEGR